MSETTHQEGQQIPAYVSCALFVSVLLLCCLIYFQIFGERFQTVTVIGVTVSTIVALGCILLGRQSRNLRNVALLILSLLSLISVINLFCPFWTDSVTGDRSSVIPLMTVDAPYPRWLMGTALSTWLYQLIWQMPPVRANLPEWIHTPEFFVRALLLLCMVCGSLYILCKRKLNYQWSLLLLSPMWVYFLLGHVEYYPCIAAAFILLIHLATRPRPVARPWETGMIVAILSTLYVGFWPIAFTLLIVCMAVRYRDSFAIAAVALIGFYVLLAIFWTGTPDDFCTKLWPEMNFEKSTMVPRYEGMVTGSDSLFWKSGHLLSKGHLKDLAFMASMGAGPLGFALLLIVAVRHFIRGDWRSPFQENRAAYISLWAVLGCQVAYLLLVVPQLGPVNDIDLFWSAYLVVSFATGKLLDETTASAATFRHVVLIVYCANSVVAVNILLLSNMTAP